MLINKQTLPKTIINSGFLIVLVDTKIKNKNFFTLGNVRIIFKDESGNEFFHVIPPFKKDLKLGNVNGGEPSLMFMYQKFSCSYTLPEDINVGCFEVKVGKYSLGTCYCKMRLKKNEDLTLDISDEDVLFRIS